MKKNKFLKFIVTAILSCFFLVTVSSCGGKDKYLDGEICGKATTDGTNTFSQIRNAYCEKFVYDFNTIKMKSDNENDAAFKANYAQFETEYTKKFVLGETGSELVAINIGEDNYNSAHYLFTFYTGENKTLVENYINDNVSESAKYLELIKISAYGNVDETTSQWGYFPKVSNTSYDEDEYNGQSVKNYLTSHSKACMVFSDGFVDPATGVQINKTTWKDAWDNGLLTGLFVYPMSWLVNLFVNLFGGQSGAPGAGWGQIGAILVVTIILKLLILLITFKSQSSTQKMQDIQPEILKIQSKYGQNPSAEDKQRMSMELMAVYQKYGVKPLAPFASLLITFPVFIAMYRAVMYLAVLRTGEVGGVILGNNLSTYIIGGNFKVAALIIFILMAASQIMSMKLPQILNRKRMTREAKQQQKQTSMMTNVMMIMILVMGFFMPVTMSIYWIASALVGLVQSLIMHKLNNGNKKGKYKVKKADNGPTPIPQGYKK